MALRAILLALVLTAPATAEILRVGIGTSPGSLYPPYQILAEDGTVSGLSIDVLDAIVKRTGDQVAFVYLPAPRLFAGISDGSIDLDIFSNPDWRSQYAADSVYTETYVTARMILVYRKDVDHVPQTLKDLTGKTVLVVNGFRYPGLDDWFERGDIRREFAPSTALLLKMLRAHHGSFGVADEAVFFHLAELDDLSALAPGIAVAAPSRVMMRFPKRLADTAERFNRAIEALRDSGELAGILAKYGLMHAN